jgi:hypothetical protein
MLSGVILTDCKETDETALRAFAGYLLATQSDVIKPVCLGKGDFGLGGGLGIGEGAK